MKNGLWILVLGSAVFALSACSGASSGEDVMGESRQAQEGSKSGAADTGNKGTQDTGNKGAQDTGAGGGDDGAGGGGAPDEG